MRTCDVLIVGAGFAGLVLAERLSNVLQKRCIIVESRGHVGGNCYDYYDAAGVLVHKYGPHFFHTNSDKVFNYLSKFTEWLPAVYTASSYSRGQYFSFPINLNTFEQFVGHSASPEEMLAYFEEVRVPISNPRNSEEAIISKVGWPLYRLFYEGYTVKQWGRHPKELAPAVCGQVPIRTERTDAYFEDKFQGMPRHGYSVLFDRMLSLSKNVDVVLGVSYEDFARNCQCSHLIYTGPIDAFYKHVYGALPYRTLRFEHETFGPDALKNGLWQPTVSVAYPNSEAFTRISEMKHITGQRCAASTICREYSEEYRAGKEPYYPIPSEETAQQYGKYKELSHGSTSVTFAGRLGSYKYLNMAQTVAQALAKFEELRKVLL